MFLYVLLALVIAYELLVRWQMAQPVAVKYNQSFSKVLRLLLPKTMRAVSLWRTCWLLYHPQTPQGQLSITGRRHEIDGHILNKRQWAGYPRTFPFRYLLEQLRRGYACNRYEEDARAIAGESARCLDDIRETWLDILLDHLRRNGGDDPEDERDELSRVIDD